MQYCILNCTRPKLTRNLTEGPCNVRFTECGKLLDGALAGLPGESGENRQRSFQEEGASETRSIADSASAFEPCSLLYPQEDWLQDCRWCLRLLPWRYMALYLGTPHCGVEYPPHVGLPCIRGIISDQRYRLVCTSLEHTLSRNPL